MFVDPEAAEIVFGAEVERVLIPLDPCNDVVLQESDFDVIQGSSIHEPIIKMIRPFISGIEKFIGVRGALVYDALAAYYLINSKAFTCEKMDILVETQGEHTFGMTVAEKRKTIPKKLNTLVAKSIEASSFLEDLALLN